MTYLGLERDTEDQSGVWKVYLVLRGSTSLKYYTLSCQPQIRTNCFPYSFFQVSEIHGAMYAEVRK